MQYPSKLWLLSILLLIPFSLQAGVYKYQDENGKWHFTDRPPKNKTNTAVTSTAIGQANKGNLKEALQNKFKPETKMDEASLSVITVNTNSGSGSGFFVTEDGYIITNRHVVRPSTSTQSKDFGALLEQRKQQLSEYKSDLKDDKARLKDMKLTIDEDREYMQSNAATTVQKSQYKRFKTRYERSKENYEDNVKSYRKQEREYKEDKSEFGFSSSLSNFSKKFTVVLKDGKKLKARLIRISKSHDLALLKLDHYTTPYLSLSDQPFPRQGTKVFAIGSPLGISDSLTSGIITKPDPRYLVTDTRILPGNSGGPLVDTEGKVLGVNTAVASDNSYSEGLGLAIYTAHIRIEFARELGGKI